MKKIFLFLILLVGLTSFNYSNAAMCPTGYTEINVVTPNIGNTIYVNDSNVGGNINDIAYYKGFKGITCYKLEGNIRKSWNIYRFDGINWSYTMYFGTQLNVYSFIKGNYIPEIGDITIDNLNIGTGNLKVNGINDLSEGQNINILTSWDGINYTSTNTSSGIITPISNGNININIDTSGIKKDKNVLYMKLNDGIADSNILTKKIETGEIHIDTSGFLNGFTKTLTATSNGGDLYYSITNNSTCDNSLTFNNYTELSFNSNSSNGVRICYKSVLNENDIFKLSEKIEGAGINTTPVKKSNLFDNFFKWKKGDLKDFDPLYILISSQISTSVQGTSTSKNYPKMLTDVNGDGLPDLLLTNYNYALIGPTLGSTIGIWEPQTYFALLINKGNMDYEVAYRCVYIGGQTNGTDVTRFGYYGDCVE